MERQERIIIARESRHQNYINNQTMPEVGRDEMMDTYKSYLMDSPSNQTNPSKFYQTISKINTL